MGRLAWIPLLACLGGCATLFSDAKEPVQFTSTPAGAEVIVDGRSVGYTPVTVPIERKLGERYVVLRKAGFKSRQFRLGKTLNTIAILNLCSVLSWATDALTGQLIEYAPNAYYIELPAAGPRPPGMSRRRAKARAQLFVLVSRHRILNDISRREGEYLRALARVFGVSRENYPRFVDSLASAAPDLAPLETRPQALYRAMVSLVQRERLGGWADPRS